MRYGWCCLLAAAVVLYSADSGGDGMYIDELNKNDVGELIKALGNNDEGMRRGAAEALGKLGDPIAVDPLITVLRDEDSGVRRNAARALGKFSNKTAVKPLVNALGDESWQVRLLAVCLTVCFQILAQPYARTPRSATRGAKTNLIDESHLV